MKFEVQQKLLQVVTTRVIISVVYCNYSHVDLSFLTLLTQVCGAQILCDAKW
jgi:hypothetical protein